MGSAKPVPTRFLHPFPAPVSCTRFLHPFPAPVSRTRSLHPFPEPAGGPALPVVILQRFVEIRAYNSWLQNFRRPFDAKMPSADGPEGTMKMRRMFRAIVLGWAALSVSSIANAADLGLPSPQPVPVPVYIPFSWTGFYIGGNIGLAWAQGNFTDSLG
jgi:hypothetical protein